MGAADYVEWRNALGLTGVVPYSSADGDGDGTVSNSDYEVWKASHGSRVAEFVLTESSGFVTDVERRIDIGQPAGVRTVSFSVEPDFDTTDQSAASSDVLNVYLIDPATGNVLLGDGDGRALFSMTEAGAEFTPGLVRFDGSVVTIDLSSLNEEFRTVDVPAAQRRCGRGNRSCSHLITERRRPGRRRERCLSTGKLTRVSGRRSGLGELDQYG